MPEMNAGNLLETLRQDARRMMNEAQCLRGAADAMLNQSPRPGSWSIAQVLEHLNVYSRDYLPKLEAALAAAGPQQGPYKPGWLGSYFTRLMQPGEQGRPSTKMKAPRNAQPPAALDGPAVVAEFLQHQERLLHLLTTDKSLTTRIPTSISALIRLKAGDTFRFLIAHQLRHMAQAHRAAAAIGYEWA